MRAEDSLTSATDNIMPTLSEWFACEGLPLKKCNAYRQRHGLPVLACPFGGGQGAEFLPSRYGRVI